MRSWIALAAVLMIAMTACSTQTSQLSPSPSPPASGPTSTPPPQSPSTTPQLACRIPVMVSVPSGAAPGGWITFPAGTFQSDPASLIDRGNGMEGVSYDRAFNRWIPADWNNISPDGRRYVAYAQYPFLNIVDVGSGAIRPVAMPRVNGVWTVIDYAGSGIYVTLIGGEGPAEPGLWVINPDSGHVRKLDGTQFWSQVDSRAAWGVKPGTGSTSLRRLDLKTGIVSTYLTVPYHRPYKPGDRSLELVSLNADGAPLVLERDWQHPYPWQLALVTAPNKPFAVQIPSDWVAGWPIWDNGDPYQLGRELHGTLLSRGIWLFGRNAFSGLALLGADGAARQLTNSPDIFALAGGCH